MNRLAVSQGIYSRLADLVAWVYANLLFLVDSCSPSCCLSVRMNLRRFTRLTNAHSKSHKHHVAMQAIFFAWYNFCRKHETIKQTPAMASGLTEKQWSIKNLLEAAAK